VDLVDGGAERGLDGGEVGGPGDAVAAGAVDQVGRRGGGGGRGGLEAGAVVAVAMGLGGARGPDVLRVAVRLLGHRGLTLQAAHDDVVALAVGRAGDAAEGVGLKPVRGKKSAGVLRREGLVLGRRDGGTVRGGLDRGDARGLVGGDEHQAGLDEVDL
jgi:hypothetical protein